jgi:hypothetical protein
MASVFLSYDHEDAGRARPIAAALEKAGHSVWWDRHIKGGAQYSKEIEQALELADAVVVLWSERSVESAWVRDEATSGRDRGRLVPVRIDSTRAPIGFRQFQTIEIRGARIDRDGRDALLSAVAAVAGSPAGPPVSGVASEAGHPTILRSLAIAVIAAVVLVGAYLAWNRFARPESVPTVAVAPANSSAGAAALSEDLLAKLGELQSGETNAIRLTDTNAAGSADLIFKVNGSLNGRPSANLSLLSGKDATVLWSGSFDQPSGNPADLKQQIAFSAARMLGCASEGLSLDGKQLDQKTLRLYLKICADLAELGNQENQTLVPRLRDVIARAPRFKAAWAKLLLVQARAAAEEIKSNRFGAAKVAQLRKDIAEARKVDPQMAEAALAESLLVPPRQFGRRLFLLDRALRDNPASPIALGGRSAALAAVGRMRESVVDAARAARNDSLSPQVQGQYVETLLHAGHVDQARRVLQDIERLWPGTASLLELQFRYHLRFGDPREAIRLQESLGGGGAYDRFLQARIDPSSANVDRLVTYIQGRLGSGESGPNSGLGLGVMMQALGQFNRTDALFHALERWPNLDDLAAVSDIYFRPALHGFRSDPRFMRIAHRAGLLDHWRQSGKWPDFCFEPDLPYDCKAEAANITA